VRGIGPLLLLPLELEGTKAAPSPSMLEPKALLCPPLEVLACSANGMNLVGLAMAKLIVDGPVRANHGLGGSSVPNLR